MTTETIQKAKPERSKLQTHLERSAWILAAVGLAYWKQIHTQLWAHVGYSFGFFLLSLAGFAGVYIYLQFYLPSKGITVDYQKWEQQVPRAIQVATAFGVLGSVSSVFVLWPLYSFLSPIVGFVFFMGGLSLVALIS